MEVKPKEGRLLIVDDNKSVLNALRIFLKSEFLEVITLSGPNTLMHEIATRDIDVVLLLNWIDEQRRCDGASAEIKQ